MKTVIFTVISESIPTCSNETLELDKIYKKIEECRWTTEESQLKFLQQNIIAPHSKNIVYGIVISSQQATEGSQEVSGIDQQ